MATTIFQDLFDQVDSSVIAVLSTKTTAMISLISPLVAVGFGIYLLLIAMSYMRDQSPVDGTFFDLLKRLAAWGLIIGCGMNISTYTNTVVPIVMNVPNEMSQALSGSPSASIGNPIDSIIDSYLDIIQQLHDKANEGTVPDIGAKVEAVFSSLALIIFGTPFLIIAAAFITLAKIFIAILLCVGPLFFAAALFPATRQYFEAWTGQVVNYMLLGVFYTLTAILEINILAGLMPMPDAEGTYSFASLVYICIAGVMFWVISIKLPDLAAGLGGGMAAGGFGQALRTASQAVSGGKAVGKGSAKVGRGAANAYKAAASRLGGGGAGGSIKPESAGK